MIPQFFSLLSASFGFYSPIAFANFIGPFITDEFQTIFKVWLFCTFLAIFETLFLWVIDGFVDPSIYLRHQRFWWLVSISVSFGLILYAGIDWFAFSILPSFFILAIARCPASYLHHKNAKTKIGIFDYTLFLSVTIICLVFLAQSLKNGYDFYQANEAAKKEVEDLIKMDDEIMRQTVSDNPESNNFRK